MSVSEAGYDIAAPDYVRNIESILQGLARDGHRLTTATLHGKPVYIVTDVALAKQVFEDAKNFSFAPIGLADDSALTEGTRAFVEGGFESQLVSASYDEYRDLRRLLNNAFKQSYGDRIEQVDAIAKRHLAALLDTVDAGLVDALALCRNYWAPVIADIIGVGALPLEELARLAEQSRALNEGYGLHGDRDALQGLAAAKQAVTELIQRVVAADTAPVHSVLRYFLNELDTESAIDLTRTFILGSINADSGVLALHTRLLAAHADQRARFLAMSDAEQQAAVTELAAKEASVQYMPRFAVQDVTLCGVAIPAGSCIQLALHGMNSCANPDFDIARNSPGACPAHNNKTIPFGHGRHKCPGEALARHLIPLFLNGLFGRFRSVEVVAFKKHPNPFSRNVSELMLALQQYGGKHG